MNRKGQIQIGTLIVLAVALIVGLVLVTDGISEPVGTLTQTTSLNNATYAAPATAGASINLPYQALRGDIVVTNATSGTLIPASNYTITNYVVSNGQLVTTLTAGSPNTIGWHNRNINISASIVEPFGYDTNGGGRAIAGLIIVFAALALAVTAVTVVLKNGGYIFD